MPIRMKDIAQELGLSSITVSKVLRNHPDISEETKQRVLQRVAELDYRPNEVARGLATGRSYLVGLVVPGLLHSFFSEVATGLSNVIGGKGYSLIVASSEEKHEYEEEEIRKLQARRLDALVIASSGSGADLFEKLDKQRQPYILIDRKVPGLEANFVGIDDEKAGLIATKHLFEIGRRRIAHIAGRINSTGQGRLEGYRKALSELGLPYQEEFVVCGAFVDTRVVEQGYEAMNSLLKLTLRPDAVFCHNDPLAIGAMSAVLDAGLRIPEDVAVIGCGNLYFNSYLRVALSSIDQHAARLGECAGELILDILHAKAKPAARTIILEPDLVVRQSTKCDQG
jgi:LacI family transcriptional regulator